jgi:hypothetical protein
MNTRQASARRHGFAKRVVMAATMGMFLGACQEAGPTGIDTSMKSKFSNSASYVGNGLTREGNAWELTTERCGIANGAEVEGPYLLWVLTASGSSAAEITGPWGTADMIQSGNGTFKYVSAWYDPTTLPGHVSAVFNGRPKNAQLVVSHGCRPYTENGAWCSPGFWKNAKDAAWDFAGAHKSDLFNTTVHDYFYGAELFGNPSLGTVLGTSGGTYKGAPEPGTSGHALNAYNAVGAYLTQLLPNHDFDFSLMSADDATEACPIDHHGNLKQ